jgi:GNAT superfamily N-acetyltransferase
MTLRTHNIHNLKAFSPESPVVEALTFHHDGADALEATLLDLDLHFARFGLSMRFLDFQDVAATNARQRGNWPFFMPMFNPAIVDIDPLRMFCIGARNTRGEIVVTAAAKWFDARRRPLSAIVDAQEFFANRLADDPEHWRTRMLCPAADEMRGILGYCGGVWVHPDYRGQRLPGPLAQMVNVIMLATWRPDRLLGFVRSEAEGTPYHHRYGFAHADRSMHIYRLGRLLIDAVLVHMSADEALAALVGDRDVRPQIDAGVVGRGGQHAM